MSLSRLEQLAKKRDEINAQIQNLKAKESKEERKLDTRRKVIIGSAVMDLVKNGQWTDDQLKELLDPYLTKSQDRSLFGLGSPS